MTTAEEIHNKVIQLPPKAQEEILEAVERIEEKYFDNPLDNGSGRGSTKHVLERLAEIQIEGPHDLAERHDYYAHGKLED